MYNKLIEEDEWGSIIVRHWYYGYISNCLRKYQRGRNNM